MECKIGEILSCFSSISNYFAEFISSLFSFIFKSKIESETFKN